MDMRSSIKGMTRSVMLTAESGERITQQDALELKEGRASGLVIEVFPEQKRQQIHGIGSSFTESTAFVLAHLEADVRKDLMQEVFSDEGANFSVARAVMAATDFSVEGRFSYCDVVDDTALAHFSIDVDSDGFSRERYPGIADETYDVLPMIKEALAIKERSSDGHMKIVSSAWTAPFWMKDNEDWYTKPTHENGHNGYGGALKPGMEALFSEYIRRYLQAYREEGVNVWGITPANEPEGNNGQWESLHFSAETQRDFIAAHLGPMAQQEEVKLFIFDQNRSHLPHWAETIFGDPAASQYVTGAAVHWYDSTEKVYEEALESTHQQYPDMEIIQSEGCIDDLGNEAPHGVLDPERYQEKDWFGNDEFWWNKNATDWAYTATWHGVTMEDHPIYTPVHRYARDIIGCINHWVTAWIDWNLVLDARGGPNHVGNYCGAPIMIDTATREIYRTPLYYVLSQISRSVRPGDHAVGIDVPVLEDSDALHACATVNDAGDITVQCLNTTGESQSLSIQIGDTHTSFVMPANALMTIQI